VTEAYVDASHRTLFGSECLNLWLAFYCDFFGAAMVLSVACFAISQWRVLGSSSSGLAFSQSIQMLVRAARRWAQQRRVERVLGGVNCRDNRRLLTNASSTPP
jgi:hypothetical protein